MIRLQVVELAPPGCSCATMWSRRLGSNLVSSRLEATSIVEGGELSSVRFAHSGRFPTAGRSLSRHPNDSGVFLEYWEFADVASFGGRGARPRQR